MMFNKMIVKWDCNYLQYKLDKCYDRTRLTDISTMLNHYFHEYVACEHKSRRTILDFLFGLRNWLRKNFVLVQEWLMLFSGIISHLCNFVQPFLTSSKPSHCLLYYLNLSWIGATMLLYYLKISSFFCGIFQRWEAQLPEGVRRGLASSLRQQTWPEEIATSCARGDSD